MRRAMIEDSASRPRQRRGSAAWLTLACLLALPSIANSEEPGAAPIVESSEGEAATGNGRPLSVAPIGVERDVVLPKGGVRLSYRYKHSSFEDLRDGGGDRRPSELFARGFTQAPLRMQAEEHDFGLYMAPHDRVTLRAAVAYRRIEMDVQPVAGGVFKLRGEGFDDLRLGAIIEFMEKGDERLDVLFDVIAPTGELRVSDDVPGGRERVPYALRPAAGSWSLESGLNYQGRTQYVGWGGRATTLFRLDRNGLRYKEGNRYTVSGWLTQAWADWVNTSQRLEWSKWGNVHGRDRGLTQNTPANDPKAQGGERLDLAFGLELAPEIFGRQRLGVEAGIPVLQDLDGPQLELDWWMQVGWRTVF